MRTRPRPIIPIARCIAHYSFIFYEITDVLKVIITYYCRENTGQLRLCKTTAQKYGFIG